MKFSIIICGYNESEHLDVCLSAAVNQNYPKDQFEVIYIDNNSTDGSLDIARKYPIQSLVETRQGPSEARNKGIASAKGELLLFVDSDAELEHEYLKLCEEIFDNPKIGGSTGQILPFEETWISNYLAVSLLEGTPRFNKRKFVRACPSGNMTVPKKVLNEVGVFLEKLTSNGNITRFSEDKELSARIRKAGYVLVYDPRIKVRHDNASTFNRLFCIWVNGSHSRAGMIELGQTDGLSMLFKYNMPLVFIAVLFLSYIFLPNFFIGLLVMLVIASIGLSIRSISETGLIVQSIFIKPWMDVISLLIVNSVVLTHRIKNSFK